MPKIVKPATEADPDELTEELIAIAEEFMRGMAEPVEVTAELPNLSSADGPDEDYPDLCPVCGSDFEWEDCWQCHGDGGFHDCGEDCCCCLDKEEITVDCEVCKGEGGYRICISASRHPAAQVESEPKGGE